MSDMSLPLRGGQMQRMNESKVHGVVESTARQAEEHQAAAQLSRRYRVVDSHEKEL